MKLAALFDSPAAHDFLDALFPPLCALCRAAEIGDGLGCEEHRLAIGLTGPRCGRCATALPIALPDGERCSDCRRDAPAFRSLDALCEYRGGDGVASWLLALKYAGRRDLAEPLGRLLAACVASRPELAPVSHPPALGEKDCESSPDRAGAARTPLVVAVPLHPLRRFERGYDQARLLARAAADTLGFEERRVLRRTRFTSVQGAIGSPSRSANVHGAFALRRFVRRSVIDRTILLVDDVATSGSTLDECARVLLRAGAKSVHAAVIARAGA